jgi:hypothetical protein
MQVFMFQRFETRADQAALAVAMAVAVLASSTLGCGAAQVAPCRPHDGSALAAHPSEACAMTLADAIRDASVAEPSEVSTQLTAIVASSARLRWKGAEPHRKALFVTWTSWNFYDDKIGKEIPLPSEMWVTAAPELQDFCHALATEAPVGDKGLAPSTVLRVEQRLGLHAGGGKDRFVEIWADPSDLFRPCPDPEITDHECSLSFPATATPEHVIWFNNKKAGSYGDGGYPWTRLGYTYDWGRSAGTVGLSEFVVRGGAMVEIKAVSTNGEYCR